MLFDRLDKIVEQSEPIKDAKTRHSNFKGEICYKIQSASIWFGKQRRDSNSRPIVLELYSFNLSLPYRSVKQVFQIFFFYLNSVYLKPASQFFNSEMLRKRGLKDNWILSRFSRFLSLALVPFSTVLFNTCFEQPKKKKPFSNLRAIDFFKSKLLKKPELYIFQYLHTTICSCSYLS